MSRNTGPPKLWRTREPRHGALLRLAAVPHPTPQALRHAATASFVWRRGSSSPVQKVELRGNNIASAKVTPLRALAALGRMRLSMVLRQMDVDPTAHGLKSQLALLPVAPTGRGGSKNSSPAEGPEDALICVRWVSIIGEDRLILIRPQENSQQLGKW
jgi:hypothetical protein